MMHPHSCSVGSKAKQPSGAEVCPPGALLTNPSVVFYSKQSLPSHKPRTPGAGEETGSSWTHLGELAASWLR